MYLPLMAVVTGIVVGLYGSSAVRQRLSRRLAGVALAVVAIALGSLTIKRNTEHQSWMTLAQTTLERWPTDVAHAAVGGELSRLRRDEDALPLLRIGARSDVRARYNLGITLFNLKRYDEAIRELEVLVTEHPMREEVPWSRRVMGHAYARLSRWPEAIAQLRMTLAMTPARRRGPEAPCRRVQQPRSRPRQAQKFGEAIVQFRNALGFDERNASARYNLATALFDAGQMKEAFVEAERALALNPANADAHHLDW